MSLHLFRHSCVLSQLWTRWQTPYTIIVIVLTLKSFRRVWRPRRGLNEDRCSGGHGSFLRGQKFGWKALWDSTTDSLCLKQDSRRRSGAPIKPSCLGRVRAASCFVCYTLEFVLLLRKSTENSSVTTEEMCQLIMIQYVVMVTFDT